MLVIVRHITDPATAATALEQRGEQEQADAVRALGVGRHLLAGPQFQYRADADQARQQLRATAVPGLTYKISHDYDPDWSKQRTAAHHAKVALPHGAIAVVNAYHASYYNWSEHHAIPVGGQSWRNQADAMNYRHGAYLVVHAMADLHPEPAALIAAARAGFAAIPITASTLEEQVVHCITATLHDARQGDLGTIVEHIEGGANGDS